PLIGARDHDLPARIDEQGEEPTGGCPSSTCRELLEDEAIVEDDLRSDATFVARFADPGLQRAKERHLPPVRFSRCERHVCHRGKLNRDDSVEVETSPVPYV